MKVQVSDVDRLVFGFNTLNFLDFAWLHERMADAKGPRNSLQRGVSRPSIHAGVAGAGVVINMRLM
ncbi:hypothetical protein [Cupriavidus necator]|uniref:hypothetical protein n=1 Tax=Cupriavidus necator TaxID=106590 RepID=UPI00129D994B|nr:hypothetical protein [Cupriavidus necator]